MAVFQYKCRRCGAVHGSTCTSAQNAMAYMMHLIHGLPDPKLDGVPAPEMMDTHRCEFGGMGVSDLTGYKLEPGEAQT